MPLGLAPIAFDPIADLADVTGERLASGQIRFAGVGTPHVDSKSIGTGLVRFSGTATPSRLVSAKGSGAIRFSGAATPHVEVSARGRGTVAFRAADARAWVDEALPTDLSGEREALIVYEQPHPAFAFDVLRNSQPQGPTPRGEAYLVCRDGDWTVPFGVVPGTRVVEDDGPGLAIVAERSSPQDRVLSILVREPFARPHLRRHRWRLRPRRVIDITAKLPPRMRTSRLLPEAFAEFERLMIDEVEDAALRLGSLRSWDEIEDKYLKLLQSTLGCFLDLQEMTPAMHRRVLSELNWFYTIKGARSFVDFMGFVLDAEFDVAELWTRDYKTFVTHDEIPDGTPDRTYYPTNRVRLTYRTNEVELPEPQLKRMFYDLASAVLVLQEIRTRADARTNVYYLCGAFTKSRHRVVAEPDPAKLPPPAVYYILNGRDVSHHRAWAEGRAA